MILQRRQWRKNAKTQRKSRFFAKKSNNSRLKKRKKHKKRKKNFSDVFARKNEKNLPRKGGFLQKNTLNFVATLRKNFGKRKHFNFWPSKNFAAGLTRNFYPTSRVWEGTEKKRIFFYTFFFLHFFLQKILYKKFFTILFLHFICQ